MGIMSALESKNMSPDWGVLERFLGWAFGGGVSSSGIIVTPQTALQAATVYSCCKVLAESIGMLPCALYTKDSDGARHAAENHPLFYLLHDQPNDFQTIVEFFEMLIMSLCLRGNAYAYVNRTRSGRVVELLPLHPDMVRVEMRPDWSLSYQVTLPDGTLASLSPGELFHVRGQTLNGWLGISPIAYARESIGLALATEKFGGQLFRNGAKMGGVLEHPGKVGETAYNRLKDTFDAAYSGENAHKTAILEEGMKWSKVSMTADDSQFLETRKYQRSEIAAIFRVPPHMIGDLEKATFSNIEQQGLEFVTYSLMPYLVRIEKAVKRDLLSPAERKSMTVKFNIAALLRGDGAARSLYYHNGILDGWLVRNEARRSESELGIILNPIQGLDTPLMPLNMTDGTGDPDEVEETQEVMREKAQIAEKAMRLEMLERKVDSLQPTINVTLNQEPVAVTVSPPTVTVNAITEEKAAPNVQIDVHVPPMPVPVVNNTVNVPQQPAPIVKNDVHVPSQPAPNVTLEAILPPLNVVATMPARKRTSETKITRNGDGEIVKSTTDSKETDL